MLKVDCNRLHEAGLRLRYLSARTDWLCSRLTDSRNKLAMSNGTMDQQMERLERQIRRLREESEGLKRLADCAIRAAELYHQREFVNLIFVERIPIERFTMLKGQAVGDDGQTAVFLHQIARSTEAQSIVSQQDTVRCYDRMIAELVRPDSTGEGGT